MREQEDTGELASWRGSGGGPHLGSSWVGSRQGHQDQGRWGRSDQKWGKLLSGTGLPREGPYLATHIQALEGQSVGPGY